MDAGFSTEFDCISHVHLMESVLHLAPYRPGRSPALPFILQRSAKLSKRFCSEEKYIDNTNYKRLSEHFLRRLEHYPTPGPGAAPLLLANILSAE
jgi:hypothetical protein